MSLIARTWIYGTQKTGKVESASARLIMVSVANEAFALVNHGCFPIPEEGRWVTIEFTQGGPKGGYWRIVEVKP
jgi:hypothetical protein